MINLRKVYHLPFSKIYTNPKMFVRLVDVMPRVSDDVFVTLNCDKAIVQSARVSYGNHESTTDTSSNIKRDKELIKYLVRNRHTSPFEMVEFKFHLAMPIFIQRQWIRHRTASVNEISGRYVPVEDFYIPVRGNDQATKIDTTPGLAYDGIADVEYLREKLNRPIRVCGMVKNEGEPGGGPFWVKDQNSQVSLQIVESAQINQNDKSQKNILMNATHFNPVDLVCGVRNYKGETFNLEDFVDHKAAFITAKTKAGKDLKALELPGLWNGSMAFWNTIFVEVPIITFNPVKTVNDLLKDSHQIK